MAELIKSEKWYSNGKSDKADEARRIIQKAAKLVKYSIRNKQTKSTYLSSEKVSSKWIPETLRAFLWCLIKSDVKIERIVLQCIAKNETNESNDDLPDNDEGFTTFVANNVDHNTATSGDRE